MFVIFLFLLGCYGCWEREGCWVAVAVRKERENLKGEREKNKKLLMYIVVVTAHICTVRALALENANAISKRNLEI